jgi:hypothetical protein
LNESKNKIEVQAFKRDISFSESCFRLLKSLALQNLFSIEKCFHLGFINHIDEYLENDVCYQYICIIIQKICEQSYYKHMIYNNDKLLEKLMKKFLENKNKFLIGSLLSVLTSLSEEEPNICKRMLHLNLIDLLPNYIRFYDNNIKILSLNLLVNVLSQASPGSMGLTNNITNGNNNHNGNGQHQITTTTSNHEALIMWSISILLNLVKEENATNKKIRALNILSIINRRSLELQTIFYNLDGIDQLLKELRSLFTEEKLKEMEDYTKQLKSNKNKKIDKMEKEEENINNFNSSIQSDILEESLEYRGSILECLASCCSLKEDCRKKVIESKELNIILYSLESENQNKILLRAANLILSLSRAHISVKKYLSEFDITSTLFKLSQYPNVEIQIAITNSLCNFLLDQQNNLNDIIECISKLLKIFSNTKHNKIRYNAICAIKNIMYYSSQKPEVKKGIMKKMTYDLLLNLLDDEDVGIQEQVLLILRVLVFKSTEEIEEVFSNCKVKLLKKIEEKLACNNPDLILQSLYVLCNISTGLEKQKSVVLDPVFLKRISAFLVRILIIYLIFIGYQ